MRNNKFSATTKIPWIIIIIVFLIYYPIGTFLLLLRLANLKIRDNANAKIKSILDGTMLFFGIIFLFGSSAFFSTDGYSYYGSLYISLLALFFGISIIFFKQARIIRNKVIQHERYMDLVYNYRINNIIDIAIRYPKPVNEVRKDIITFYPSNTGRTLYFGVMDILLAVLEKYHQLPYKSILKTKVNGYKFTRLIPPPKGSGFPPTKNERILCMKPLIVREIASSVTPIPLTYSAPQQIPETAKAYICKTCGAQTIIQPGVPKICDYCNTPF